MEAVSRFGRTWSGQTRVARRISIVAPAAEAGDHGVFRHACRLDPNAKGNLVASHHSYQESVSPWSGQGFDSPALTSTDALQHGGA